MSAITRRTLFLLFFLSGFSSLIYQVVWTRMAFASFGIITPVLSVVLSVFMLGLAVGSLAGGWVIGPLVRRTGFSAAFFYAGAEFLIGISAFAVPELFVVSARLLLPAGQMDSVRYLLLSTVALAISIFPWCVCMGATFPLMMAYVRERDRDNAKSFSFLYLANVLGAMTGTFLTAFVLVEVFGFHRTLEVAAGGNFIITVVSSFLGMAEMRKPQPPLEDKAGATGTASANFATTPLIKVILFSTGVISMAMEVVWSRAFTVALNTQVYSFAAIVFTYLGATFVGSLLYRRALRSNRVASLGSLLSALAIAAFLPVMLNDTRIVRAGPWIHFDPWSAFIVLLSICPPCALLGYLTPRLIDDYSAGQPRKAGEAYAINILGCILGPLVGCYFLLPWLSEGSALILLGLPLVGFWLATSHSQPRRWRIAGGSAIVAILIWDLFFSLDFEHLALDEYPNTVIRRDYVASVVSFGNRRENKSLLVNGIGMTKLTPICKFMADLPLASHRGQPKSVLVICFGMGTTYRSALSWHIDATAVELVPSVVDAFGFYHDDAAKCLNDPHGHIVIDDGRRYLKRCNRKFDVIIVDPPPPVEAAGSSLLFSKEFYALAREHLNPNGILQMWNPSPTGLTNDAIVRSIYESFPYVRCYRSMEGWGLHLLGSMQPFDQIDAVEMAARMPVSARDDLLEWSNTEDLPSYIAEVVDRPATTVLNSNPDVQITDNEPFNEYFILRQIMGRAPQANPER